jgi:hypothetical protein
MLKQLIALFVMLTCVVSPAFAAKEEVSATSAAAAEPALAPIQNASTESKIPDTSKILFMQNLRKIGASIYYLGQAMGLNSWFVIKDKQVQVFYTTPDSRALLVGVLLSSEGANLSQQQVMLLSNSHPEVAVVLRSGNETTVNVAPLEKPEPDLNANAVKDAKIPPSEKLYAELEKAPSVSFGPANAAQLLMVMDVRSDFCLSTWKKLQPLVDSGKLRVTLIPVEAKGVASETQAAILLAKKDPYEAWKQHVAGDDKILKEGKPDRNVETGIFNTTQLVRNWSLGEVPYLLYRGKNGKIRLVQGEPKDVQNIMNDIAN